MQTFSVICFHYVQDCVITFQLSQGNWPAAVIVEDFISESSNTPLSKTPLQFIIDVAYSFGDCSHKPIFVSPTPEDGLYVDLVPGDDFTIILQARSSYPDSV